MDVLLALHTDGPVVGAFLGDCCDMLLGSLDSLQYGSICTLSYVSVIISYQCLTIDNFPS